MARVSKLNEQLGHYVLRFLAADALHAEPMSPNAERALANQVAVLAGAMQARADRRDQYGEPAPLIPLSSRDEQA
jgi:hypothetical protein